MRQVFPDAKIIAEDLGEIGPSVGKLRDQAGLPGMAILQFAFGGRRTNPYLPYNLEANSVVYPGTHDNDTTLGWYATVDDKTRDHVRRYLRVGGQEVGWDFIRAAYGAVSRLAIASLQDILSLGAEARFNFPSRPEGNWQWRFRAAQLDRLFDGTAGYLRELADLHGRLPEPEESPPAK